ncbi:DUF3576 domain-containing protein [Hyphomonas pacifica]|uniref:Uncharacterized protein n=1 Tax=Hyphomonas pacifica TaxID=1280941 RepID=A0A062TT45_9PROT|nr:DUF3576 domain-containing protein [Hyphomonas pacifica]KCZ51136.1 hypothetical protein HY2_12430 [Hyphomonas pacifica]RAN33595.1 hypothetical protein HY3_12530 [Hyphomonas pacifica]RAN37045.1 hypothetical protein HY11_10580 [Hyphomonas pacifica]
MIKFVFSAAVAGMLLVSGCQSRSVANTEQKVAQQNIGSVNPYLWRAALDTFDDLPVKSADPIGGLIVYDWKTFDKAPGERIKATVYILDTRLRADGVKVSVFRQTNENGEWVDAPVDPVTGVQLENKILERARILKNSQLG